jgi:hypothetical protein
VANTVKVRSGGLLELNANPTIAGLNDEGGSGGLVSVVNDNRTLDFRRQRFLQLQRQYRE